MKTINKILLAIVAIGTLHACSTKTAQNEQLEAKNTIDVETYLPHSQEKTGVYLSGEVVAKESAAISTRMMGFIDKITVKPGDSVIKGQLLVLISNDEVMAKKRQVLAMITEAEAAAKNAQRDYERFKRLHKQHSVSDKELENVELQNTSMQAKVKMAKEQLKEVETALSYTEIRAPFSGVITQKMGNEGGMANPGMPLLMLEKAGNLEIKASVSENYIPYIKRNEIADVTIKSIDTHVKAVVKEVSPSAVGTGGQYFVKLALKANNTKNIHAGMFANLFIPTADVSGKRQPILINKTSLIKRDQLVGVYVVNNDNEVHLHWVRLGKTEGEQVEVLSGVNRGDRVVLKAEGKLYNGAKVAIKK